MSLLGSNTNRCSCGCRYFQEAEKCRVSVSDAAGLTQKTNDQNLLDLSFVQISSSILLPNETLEFEENILELTKVDSLTSGHGYKQNPRKPATDSEKQSNSSCENSFWDKYQSLKEVEASQSGSPKSLRMGLVRRMKQALEKDSERLIAECKMFENAIQVDLVSRKIWDQTVCQYTLPGNILVDNTEKPYFDNTSCGQGAVTVKIDSDSHDENNLQKAVLMFQHEIELLEETYRQCELENRQLDSLQAEQCLRRRKLDKLYDSVAEAQIEIELEAKAFDNDHEQLCRMLAVSQEELDCISSPTIRLPTILLHMQVDERGLRYPLINELRLAYRPKGDVHWEEIQGAWSLAAQLLLFTGNIFGFHSKHCKIVPMSVCAKLIYHPPIESFDPPQSPNQEKRSIVYNLGHPSTNTKKALLTWNALMCQIIHYVHTVMLQVENEVEGECVVPAIPFAVSSTTVGSITLTKLNENDDVGWSKAIQYMASNLLWLSECASIFCNNVVVTAC